MPTGKEWEVRLWFLGSTGQAAVPATLTHRSKGEDSEERECHQEQELRAKDPLGAAAALPQGWRVSGSQPEFTLGKPH